MAQRKSRHSRRTARALLPLVVLSLMLASASIQAALSIAGTRFVYPAGTVSQTIRVGNSGDQPVLVQAWLDQGDANADPTTLAVPFLLSPPIARIDPQGSAALQLRHTGEPLPAERESVYWINFLEVPPKPGESDHLLKVVFRMRMKVLYRPAGLPGSPVQAIEQLRWRMRPGGAQLAPELEARNDTPYFVSLAAVQLPRPDEPLSLGGLTIPPFGSARLTLPSEAGILPDGQPLRYEAVGDAGEAIHGEARVQP